MRTAASKVTMRVGLAAASSLLLAAACGGATSVDGVGAPVDAGPDVAKADGFSCRPRGCVTNGEEGCFQRELPDGSVETYATSTTSDFGGFESQFTSCSPALYDTVTAITQLCP